MFLINFEGRTAFSAIYLDIHSAQIIEIKQSKKTSVSRKTKSYANALVYNINDSVERYRTC